jgi:hypothetical protein
MKAQPQFMIKWKGRTTCKEVGILVFGLGWPVWDTCFESQVTKSGPPPPQTIDRNLFSFQYPYVTVFVRNAANLTQLPVPIA